MEQGLNVGLPFLNCIAPFVGWSLPRYFIQIRLREWNDFFWSEAMRGKSGLTFRFHDYELCDCLSNIGVLLSYFVIREAINFYSYVFYVSVWPCSDMPLGSIQNVYLGMGLCCVNSKIENISFGTSILVTISHSGSKKMCFSRFSCFCKPVFFSMTP